MLEAVVFFWYVKQLFPIFSLWSFGLEIFWDVPAWKTFSMKCSFMDYELSTFV